MYVKIFAQILDSSIAEDYLVRLVFEDILKLADKDGVVDMTASAIARRTNVPLDIVSRGLEKLAEPDPSSRSLEEGGRRIVLIDSQRPWGWRIVNYLHYRGIRDGEDRKAYFRERKAAQRSRSKNVQDSQGQSLNVTQAEAEAEAEAHISGAKAPSPRRGADGGRIDPSELIYSKFPRKEGRRAAIKAIENATSRLRKGEAELSPMETGDAHDLLLRRTQAYAESPAGRRADKSKIPHPATWFNGSRYLDDETCWQFTGEERGAHEIDQRNQAGAVGRINRGLSTVDASIARRARVGALPEHVPADGGLLPSAGVRP